MEGLFLYLSVETKYMKKSKILETDRLLIRPTNVDDAAFILELLNTPKWISFIGDRKVETIKEAQKYIEVKMVPQLQRLGFTNNTVILKDGNEKIGICGLFDREEITGTLELGFAFLPIYERNGYAFESATRLIKFGFEELEINSIRALTAPKNIASQNLLVKLGFDFQGEITFAEDEEISRWYEMVKNNYFVFFIN